MKKIILAFSCIASFTSLLAMNHPIDAKSFSLSLLADFGRALKGIENATTDPHTTVDALAALSIGKDTLLRIKDNFPRPHCIHLDRQASRFLHRLQEIPTHATNRLLSWTTTLRAYLPYFNGLTEEAQQRFLARLQLYGEIYNSLAAAEDITQNNQQKLQTILAYLTQMRAVIL